MIKTHIPEDAEDIVVFVHGFGVRWDSRGMFTDIQAALPAHWGSVLFDLYRVVEQDVFITSVAHQVEAVRTMVANVQSRNPATKVHIVAHSKGCIVTALAQPDITGKAIFLAPPQSFGTKLEKYFARYPGATKTKTELIIPRKDATTTHIPLGFFAETSAIDAEQAIASYAAVHPVYVLQTTHDEVIGPTEYKTLRNQRGIQITSIPADHNFTMANRALLLTYLKTTLGYST